LLTRGELSGLIPPLEKGRAMRRALSAAAALLMVAALAVGGWAVFDLRSLGLRIANLAPIFSGTRLIHNAAYGGEPWQKLDIYARGHTPERKKPVVVFFYGGRWQQGAKENYRFAGDAIAKRGYIAVLPDYSKYPSVRFPAFVEDGAKAVAWVAARIGDYGGDANRIFVAGHSAGAHIGALLAANPSYLEREGTPRGVIKGFAGLAGPYAFTPKDPDLVDIFGPPERFPAMQVTSFIDGTQPPMLLLYGATDNVVHRYNLDRLETRIREKGGTVKSIIYPGVDHIWIMAAMSWTNFAGPSVTGDMISFFDRLQ
jgi:acetyl esterase/lipase